MVNGISSSSTNSYLTYLQTHPTKHKPSAEEMFKKVDTDGSGGISQSELDSLAKKISSETGQTIDTSNAISTYDSDGNGELSSSEMDAFMKSTMQQGVGHMGMQAGGGPGDLFNAITGGSSQMTQVQLDTWATDMSQATGNTIDTTKAISTYDTNSDGTLSSTEFKSFLDSLGIQPPTSQDSSNSSASTDLFNAITGGSSQMTQAQLDTWATDMSQATGNTIDTTNTISTYDTNGDGTLNSTEFKSFLDASGISAPQNAGIAPPPPPPASSGSSDTSSSSSANSVISKYDTNGDGVLSATELQAYLDDQSSSSVNSLVAQALSAYTSSFGTNQTSSLQDLFMSLSGSNGTYSPIDFSI